MVTVGQLLAITGGQLLQGAPETVAASVTTDSRAVDAGAAFFALSGERFDGHAYAAAAAQQGAVCVVAAKTVAVPSETAVIQVSDVLAAYQQVAAWHRRQFAIPVIAITGSNGKTSTKELIAAVLQTHLAVLKTQGNFNNEIGLPKTLLQLNEQHEAAVVEMGMRQLGEIRLLAKIANPTIGVVTNVGETHIERLGSIENIARAKQELVENLSADSLAVLNGDDAYVRKMAPAASGRVVFYGEAADCDFRLLTYELRAFDSVFSWQEKEGPVYQATLPIPGKHQLLNALAAIAVARYVGMAPAAINQALAQASLGDLRQQLLTYGDLRVLNDAYNASPLSMAAALELLTVVGASSRRVALLGDMLELGETAARAHREVGQKAAACGVVVLAAVGEFAPFVVQGAQAAGLANCAAFGDKAAAWQWLAPQLAAQDLVLLKGSRGLQMETFLPLFSARLLDNCQNEPLAGLEGGAV